MLENTEIAADWYDAIYTPTLDAIDRLRLGRLDRSAARDLFLVLHRHRRDAFPSTGCPHLAQTVVSVIGEAAPAAGCGCPAAVEGRLHTASAGSSRPVRGRVARHRLRRFSDISVWCPRRRSSPTLGSANTRSVSQVARCRSADSRPASRRATHPRPRSSSRERRSTLGCSKTSRRRRPRFTSTSSASAPAR